MITYIHKNVDIKQLWKFTKMWIYTNVDIHKNVYIHKNVDIKNDYIHKNVDIHKCRYSQNVGIHKIGDIYRNVAIISRKCGYNEKQISKKMWIYTNVDIQEM